MRSQFRTSEERSQLKEAVYEELLRTGRPLSALEVSKRLGINYYSARASLIWLVAEERVQILVSPHGHMHFVVKTEKEDSEEERR